MNLHPDIYAREIGSVASGSWFYTKIGDTVSLCLKITLAAGEDNDQDPEEFERAIAFGSGRSTDATIPHLIEVASDWTVLDIGRNFMIDLKMTADSFDMEVSRPGDQRPAIVLIGKRRFIRVNEARQEGQYRPAYVAIPSGELLHRLPDVADALVRHWDLRPVVSKQAQVAYSVDPLLSERGDA
jgi:hypothetical protein